MKNIITILAFLLCSTTLYAQTTYTTTISPDNQQVIKGLGGGLPWASEMLDAIALPRGTMIVVVTNGGSGL